jgi:hypothetical protein
MAFSVLVELLNIQVRKRAAGGPLKLRATIEDQLLEK